MSAVFAGQTDCLHRDVGASRALKLAARGSPVLFKMCHVAARQGIRRNPLPDRLPIKRAMAVHEAGKALVASLLRQRTGRLEKVERVSMVPRGRRVTLNQRSVVCPLSFVKSV